MSRLEPQLWRQFWPIAKPYWQSQEQRGAIGLLLVLLLLAIASSAFLVLETFPIGEMISALATQNYARLVQGLGFFLGVAVLSIPIYASKNWVRDRLSLDWRRWMTHSFLRVYFHPESFYPLHNHQDIDNPDQRIAEDIKTVTQQTLIFLIALLETGLQVVAFTGILWSISPLLMGILLGYVGLSTGITIGMFGPILTAINVEQLKQEANFRFGLMRVRNHAESIAFYRGQAEEAQQARQRFVSVFQNFSRLIRWQLRLNLFQNSYQYLTLLLPIAILAPRILSGDLELGAVTQSQIAFERIGFTLGLVIHQFAQLSAFAAAIERLASLEQVAVAEKRSLLALPTAQTLQTQIEITEDSHLALHKLTLKTPHHDTTLIENLSILVSPGQSLLIVGASGVGKSSLLRAIAGLWRSGSGRIVRPPHAQVLFLPQRPYMTLGSLRDQLLYPSRIEGILDMNLRKSLQCVNLGYLETQFGGLDVVEDWEQVLSEGEQQRLAFARLLLTQPTYALLDEATSALDLSNEANLYKQLQTSSTTYVSVGHRLSLLTYHTHVLELKQSQEADHPPVWKLMPADKYEVAELSVHNPGVCFNAQ